MNLEDFVPTLVGVLIGMAIFEVWGRLFPKNDVAETTGAVQGQQKEHASEGEHS